MRMHVERRGKGKPILLLHGLMGDHRQVESLLPALQDCEVLMPDLLGCGKSDRTPSPDIIERNAVELKALCERESIDTVIGFSIGGLVAMELQLPNTVLIASFCMNPLTEGPLKSLHGREPQIERLLRNYKSQAELFIRSLPEEPTRWTNDASISCAIEYMRAATDDRTRNAQQSRRALVLHGINDKLIDCRLGMQLAAACRAQLVIVPEGHFSILKNETVHHAISVFVAASVRDE